MKILLKEFLPKKSLSNNLLVAFLFFSSNRSSCSHKGPKKSLSKKAEEGQKEKGPQKSLSKKAEEGQKEKGPQKRAKKKRAHRRGPKEKEGTLKKARPRFYTIGALRPMGGLWASSNKSRAPFTLIIKFTGADSSPSKSSNSQHRIHRAWTLCLTRCTRCTSEATKKRE